MAGQFRRAGVYARRRRSSARRGLITAFEIGLMLTQQVREPPLMVKEREETGTHRTDLQ
jgi:hypothetical protein